MNVGFVGLGRMGTPMARALLRAGFPLTVFNRTSRRALLLGDEGATVAESPAEVSAHDEVVVTMLADGNAVAALTDGSKGLLAGVRPGTVYLQLAQRLGVPVSTAAAVHRAVGDARASQGDGADLAAVAQALRAVAPAVSAVRS